MATFNESSVTARDVHNVIARRLGSFESEFDLWKADRKSTMAYFELCDLLTEGVSLYKDACRLDENWRGSVYRGEIAYDERFAGEISELFRRTAAVSWEIEATTLPQVESQYQGVENADEFRRCCREMRGMFTPDAEFFQGEALVKLRDEAIDQHRRGDDSEQWPA